MTIVPVTSADLDAAEVSWFAALCSDDYAQLGQPEGALRSSFAHCRDIALEAERQGFRNILCPSSYQVGQDTLSFVAAMAPLTERLNFLAAIRCGEMQPIMLARTVATLDHMLEGRLTLNVISSDFPGETAGSAYRYKRSAEVVEILRQAWSRETIDFDGEVYQFHDVTTDPAVPYQAGGPLLYFGGYSPDAIDLCARFCDVYLMWPEPKDQIAERMRAVAERAEGHGRTLDYGLRVHVIVRDTESGGQGLRPAPRRPARRRVRPPDPRAGARLHLARRRPPGAGARARRPVRLRRAPPLDGHRPGPLGLRRGARGQRRPGAERAGGLPQDGRPRLHPVGLPASGGGAPLRPPRDAPA